MKNTFFKFTAVLLSSIVMSCGSNKQAEEATVEADSTAVDSTSTENISEISYQVPSPDDMFSLIKEAAVKGKSTNMLNPVDNAKNYVDNKTKAINFGVYSTDLLYCSSFDFGAEAIKYFATVKKLGDDVGISTAIKESTAKKIQESIGKPDSLRAISNDLYLTAFQTLENNNRGATLSLVISGAWVEGLYIVTKMVKKYSKDDPAIERIAEQKYPLENLLDYMKKYESDEGVASVILDLNKLKAIYDQLEEKSTASSMNSKNGKKMLSGGSKISITEAQYNSIVETTAQIRKSYTETK